MDKVPPAIFKAYDIRGIYPTDINEENVEQIARAIYTFFSRFYKKTDISIALGRDMRVSSPQLHAKVKEVFMKCGAQIIDIGLASTPSLYFAILHYQTDVGVQISASHNPKEYNGIKFARRDGNKIIKIGKATGMDDIAHLVAAQDFAEFHEGGTVTEKTDTLQVEVKEALEQIKPTHIRKLKIVADPANAMGALYLEELFRQLPGELIKMNFELDGTFPAHQADPLQFELHKPLQERVVAEKADLGISTDGDGDRVFFINEKGQIVPATFITALIAKAVLEQHPGDAIMFDIRYTRNAEAVIKKLGGKAVIGRVGHAFITQKLAEVNGIFAGESSGHFFFRDTGFAESAIRVIIYVLEELCKQDKPLSELLEQYHTSFESGETNFELPAGFDLAAFLQSLVQKFPEGTASTIDGMSIDFPDWRFNIRTSNTEPLMRLNVESPSQALTDQKVKEMTAIILATGATVKTGH